MANKKTTRRALFSSVISLILCCAMLIGTTFAWFTDSVTSGRNKIQSGNLDAELYYATELTGSEEDWTEVNEETKLFNDEALWEPGHTEIVYLKVKNVGSLAFKYQLGVNIYSETSSTNVNDVTFKLSDYIKAGAASVDENKVIDRAIAVTYADKDLADATNLIQNNSTNAKIEAESESGVWALVITMPTTVGNEANHKTGVDAPAITLGVNLLATQVEHESDSFGNDYDAGAGLNFTPVANTDELIAALAGGENASLASDLDLSSVEIPNMPAGSGINVENGADITVEGNGKTITVGHTAFNNGEGNEGIQGDGTLVFRNVHFKAETAGQGYALCTGFDFQGIVVFENCTFEDLYTAIYMNQNSSGELSSLTIKNCTYVNTTWGYGVDTTSIPYGKQVNVAFENNTGLATEKIRENDWEKVANVDELKAALEAGTDVVLTEDIKLTEQLEVKGDVEIIGDGNTTLTVPANGTRVVNVQDNTEPVSVTLTGVELEAADAERGISFYNNQGGLDVVIDNTTITAEHYGVNVSSNNKDATLTIKNSTLTGFCAFQTWSADTVVTFENCTLEGVNQWPVESGAFATIVVNKGADNCELTFNNCTIIATETNTAKEYHLIDNAEGTIVNWNNCTFITNGVEGSVRVA